MRFKISVLAVVALLVMTSVSYAKDKVGYINIQRIVSESQFAKEAKVELDELREKKKAEAENLQSEVASLQEEVVKLRQKKDADLSELRDMVEKFQKKDKELKRYVADANEDIKKKDNELVAQILAKAAPVLKKVAKEKGFTVILRNTNDLAYLAPEADLTDEIVKGLNKLKK